MKVSTDGLPRRTGRPLSFDRDTVLEKAMLAFWRHGYESTSLSELTAAMGISAPSIYAAFGDKKGLFREAVDRYLTAGGTTPEAFIDAAPTARDAIWGLLQGSALAFTGTNTPPGCLVATSAISCSADAADIQEELARVRQRIEAKLRHKLVDAITCGEIPARSNAAALSGLVLSIIQGMSTLARDGATRDHLLAIAAVAMRVLLEAPEENQ